MPKISQSKYQNLIYLFITSLVLFASIAAGFYILNLVSPLSETVNFIIALIVMLGIFDTFFKPFLRKKVSR